MTRERHRSLATSCPAWCPPPGRASPRHARPCRMRGEGPTSWAPRLRVAAPFSCLRSAGSAVKKQQHRVGRVPPLDDHPLPRAVDAHADLLRNAPCKRPSGFVHERPRPSRAQCQQHTQEDENDPQWNREQGQQDASRFSDTRHDQVSLSRTAGTADPPHDEVQALLAFTLLMGHLRTAVSSRGCPGWQQSRSRNAGRRGSPPRPTCDAV